MQGNTPTLIHITERQLTPANLMSIDPLFGEIVVKSVGPLDFASLLRPPYVALIGAIVGQKISYQSARVIRGKIYTALGTTFTREQFETWKDSSVIPADKLEIITRVNEFLRTKSSDYLDREENIRSLMVIPNVKDWTVKVTLLVSGKNLDVFPSEDYFIRKRVQRLFGLPSIPSIGETEKIAERWAPYRGHFAWYLWRWF